MADGFSYYVSPMAERVHSAEHGMLRSSGSTGLNLGIVAGVMFALIYLYPIRKRSAWLRSIGNTGNWLDFHILMGIVAPLLITLHSTFRFHGIAGMAFWIMWAVTLSGVDERYIYGRIPRHVTAAEMSMKEIELQRQKLTSSLAAQQTVDAGKVSRAFAHPEHEAVQKMTMLAAVATMLRLDLARPFQVSAIRRSSMSPARPVMSLGGILPFANPELEQVVRDVRKQSWLSTQVLFLSRSRESFHLWHVVHRPFSYSFAVLIVIHIGFVMVLGYF